jgi:hypothetical protein
MKRIRKAKSTSTEQAPARHKEKRYHFVLNPYPDARLSKCPDCGGKTGQRKLPLFIHIDPHYPVALNYTCRYCARCDKLFAHQAEVESLLTQLFTHHAPAAIGNDYLIMGTLERAVWRENMKNPKPPHETLEHLHPFKSYATLQRSRAGWFPAGQEPPLDIPPPSEHWVKPGARQRRKG